MRLFDLGERTECFGEAILELAKSIQPTSITRPLIEQLVRAGTNVGANYCEADDASAKKDFIYKIGICQREVKETQFWLKMILKASPNVDAANLINEAQESRLIFSSIIHKSKR